MARRAVQRKLAQEKGVGQLLGPDLLGGGQDAYGDWQVVGGAFFAQVGRGQVDGDAPPRRKGEAAVF